MVSTLKKRRRHRHSSELFGDINSFIKNVYKKFLHSPKLLEAFMTPNKGRRRKHKK